MWCYHGQRGKTACLIASTHLFIFGFILNMLFYFIKWNIFLFHYIKYLLISIYGIFSYFILWNFLINRIAYLPVWNNLFHYNLYFGMLLLDAEHRKATEM